MNWTGRNVLVTGAGGFIGSHLAEELVKIGANTRALVHYRSDTSRGWLDSSSYKDGMEIIPGDIRDADSVHRAMRGVEIVFHLAALIGIPYSYHAPLSYVRTNIDGTLNVLQAAKELGVNRVVHTSTSEVYGTARYVPIDEKHPLQAQSPYAASKIGADKLAEAFSLSFGLPVVTLRPFNTFGPRQSARAVIPTIVTQCLMGSKVRLGNMHPTRDFNFVSNTVDGFLLAALSPQAIGRTINIGSGQEISIKQLVDAVARLLGHAVIVESENQRIRPNDSEVGRLVSDNRVATEILGWTPAIEVEEGLRFTIDWIREHLHLFQGSAYAI